ARNQRNVVRKAGLQNLAKTGDTFRQKHVVDAVLQICMFAADMKLPERILRHTRKTQHRLVKWSVLAPRLRIESVRADRIARCTETRHNRFARDVEFL